MTDAAPTVAEGKVVLFHYTLTDDAGEVLDSSDGGQPLPYLHGAGNIVPGLEKQLTGLAVGAKIAADVSPEEGYGEHHPEAVQKVPRDAFPADMPLEVGTPFMAQSPDGGNMQLWIAAVEGDEVTVDMNHPLAGQTLHFAVEITGIRDATDEERTHGHPHGPDGTHNHGH